MRRRCRAVLHLVVAVLAMAGVLLPSSDAMAHVPASAGSLIWQRPTVPDPFRGYVTDVDCVAHNWCMVVDGSGQAVRFAGGRWYKPVRVESATPYSGFAEVSCASRRLCMAVDEEGRLARFHSTGWSAPRYLGDRNPMQAVSCPRPGYCMAVGKRAARWNGSHWRLLNVTLPRHFDPSSLTCTSAQFCVLVTYREYGRVSVWMYNGRRWSFAARLRNLDASNAVNMSCTSRRFCMAVGDFPFYERWDGHRWRSGQFGIPRPFFRQPAGVSCTSPRSCLVAGSDPDTGSIEWNGTAWVRGRAINSPSAGDMVGLSCAGAGLRCLEVGRMGSATRYRRHRWERTADRDPASGEVSDVACGSTVCLIADAPGGYATTHGSGWTPTRRAMPRGNFAARSETSLTCTSDTFCLELAANGRTRRFDGHSWHNAARAPFGEAQLSCRGAHWCAALDTESGQLALYNGTRWRTRLRPLGNPGESWDFACGSRTLCIATNPMGFARVYDGTRWHAKKTIGPKYETWNAVSCVSGTFCMVGGGPSTTWRFDGSRWHKFPIYGGQDAISCTSPTFCAGVGLDEVQVFDGHAWTVSTQAPNPDDLPYQEVGCASRALCVVASPAGQVQIGTGERARGAVPSR